ncbi:MAG TPA: ADP-ribosylglycohydrolase family protein [Planctomycetota bacterium]|nr:ADP-ribosylglycohydrolase family protein [Planctomycetota bacterium]
MTYPKVADLKKTAEQFELYSQLQHEYGARGVERVLADVRRAMGAGLKRLRALPADPKLAAREPNSLAAIRKLRPAGPRRMWKSFDAAEYADRLEGALMARMAGCTLGAPVEFWDIPKMQDLARENGQNFPPTEYWSYVPEPFRKRYDFSPRQDYTRDRMNGVPVDDDIVYTLLGLLVVEEFGPRFTVADNGKAWLKHLPYACTAEHVALENLKKSVPALRAGAADNPYCEWIGADIRSDPWGYMAPGWPEFAADMAWRDAYLSHRRNGVYGEMYFSAVIAAAFAVDDPVEALRLGLTEIPRDCAMADAVRWALRVSPRIRNWRQARDAAEKRFAGMHRVHTIINAVLTIWGVTIGRTDVSRVIGETVAMGLDNDCTAATAGSIVGAVVGRKGVPAKWTRPFHNTVHAYFKTHKKFRIDDLLRRFARQAERVHG